MYNKYAERAGAYRDMPGFEVPDDRVERYFSILRDSDDLIRSLRGVQLPSEFDARTQWSHCSSVHRIFNQGGCGSCWAVAVTTMIADRICIASNGTKQPSISAQYLMSCCPACGKCAICRRTTTAESPTPHYAVVVVADRRSIH